MLAKWVRQFATKRTIPYVVKNNWKLPPINNVKGKPQDNAASGGTENWGSSVASSDPIAVNVPKSWRRLKTLPQWKRQMFALKEKFPEGWDPKRKLNRDEMARLREIKAAQPQISLNALGEMFRVSPEAVRRIIKSRWRPNERESGKLAQRWVRRGVRLGSFTALQKAGPRKKKVLKQHTKLHDPGQDVF